MIIINEYTENIQFTHTNYLNGLRIIFMNSAINHLIQFLFSNLHKIETNTIHR